MLNHYALWKYLLILVVIVGGTLYALPNIYGSDPAVQITAKKHSILDQATLDKVTKALTDANLTFKTSELSEEHAVIRFKDVDTQLLATEKTREIIGENYNVAQNIVSASPAWLESIHAAPMYLGLDLRGGLHFLLQVDMEEVINKALEGYASDIRTALRKKDIRTKGLKQTKKDIEIRFDSAEVREKARGVILGEVQDLQAVEFERDNFLFLKVTMSEKSLRERQTGAIKQNITTLRKRMNETGVAEPVIQQQGLDRIVLQLPGVQCSPCMKEMILRSTATLEFRLVDDQSSLQDALKGKIPTGSRLYKFKDGTPILLKKNVIIKGDHITSAVSGVDSSSASPAVFVNLNGAGAKRLANVTKRNIKKRMSVVYLEDRIETKTIGGKQVDEKIHEEYVVNAATIQDVLSNRFQITGLESAQEAQELALFIRSGALAAPVSIVEERTIGPSLGQDSIDKGFKSVVIGLIVVVAFMLFWYRAFGVVANIALAVNLVLIVAALSLLQATLTLPGIAGIVLTVGMAVDANVLIFERIREEVQIGNTPQASIHAGYEKALSTIADANITTLIAAVILFVYGTGPIKGFAITLSIGILTSMFTAIMVTRAIVNMYVKGKRINKLWV